jgi:hypothetical protein
MSDLPPNPELLKSLGRLVRGLSALFWGLPLTLLACVQTAKSEWLRLYGIIPPLAAAGLLLYGLWLMSSFQPQERVWRIALDRAKLFGLINLGLCPFLYWWNKLPGNPLFLSMVLILAFSSVLFLSSVNVVLQRLGAMLPDEGLRVETRQFTGLNLRLLIFTFVLALIYVGLSHLERLPLWLGVLLAVLDRGSFWFLVLLVLLPLAMTMALLWKTKEVIMDSVFGSRH